MDKFPSSAEEGWLRGQEIYRAASLFRADGVVLVKKSYSLTNTTPSAPTGEAARHLLDVAATPPRLRRGNLRNDTSPKRPCLKAKPLLALELSRPSQFGQLCLARRGGCAIKKKVAQHPYSAQTAWRVRKIS